MHNLCFTCPCNKWPKSFISSLQYGTWPLKIPHDNSTSRTEIFFQYPKDAGKIFVLFPFIRTPLHCLPCILHKLTTFLKLCILLSSLSINYLSCLQTPEINSLLPLTGATFESIAKTPLSIGQQSLHEHNCPDLAGTKKLTFTGTRKCSKLSASVDSRIHVLPHGSDSWWRIRAWDLAWQWRYLRAVSSPATGILVNSEQACKVCLRLSTKHLNAPLVVCGKRGTSTGHFTPSAFSVCFGKERITPGCQPYTSGGGRCLGKDQPSSPLPIPAVPTCSKETNSPRTPSLCKSCRSPSPCGSKSIPVCDHLQPLGTTASVGKETSLSRVPSLKTNKQKSL